MSEKGQIDETQSYLDSDSEQIADSIIPDDQEQSNPELKAISPLRETIYSDIITSSLSLKKSSDTNDQDIDFVCDADGIIPLSLTKTVEKVEKYNFNFGKELTLKQVPKITYDVRLIDENTIDFFLLHIHEEDHKLFLFGKNVCIDTSTTICIQITNPIYYLYFYPIVGHEDDLIDEIRELSIEMNGYLINYEYKSLNYCFGTENLDKNTKWLECQLPATCDVKNFPQNGKNYFLLIGRTYSLTENFEMTQKIKGPQFLRAKNLTQKDPVTFCPMFCVNSIFDVEIIEKKIDRLPPPLNVCVISIGTYFNEEKKTHEIYLINVRVFMNHKFHKYQDNIVHTFITSPNPDIKLRSELIFTNPKSDKSKNSKNKKEEKSKNTKSDKLKITDNNSKNEEKSRNTKSDPNKRFTTKIPDINKNGENFKDNRTQTGEVLLEAEEYVEPKQDDTKLNANLSERVTFCSSEKKLLKNFVRLIDKLDIDILSSYTMFTNDIQVIFDRMKTLNVEEWFRIGRLNRSTQIKTSKYNTSFCLSGRIAVDIRTNLREFLNLPANDLSSVSLQEFGIKRQQIENIDILKEINDKNKVISLIEFFERDTNILTKLMEKTNLLEITFRLSQISGLLWCKTLKSKPSYRCESILLHSFKEKNFVLPDKKQKPDFNPKSKLGKYRGATVLQPKKGFYDTIIVLLDFTSLYPSIISEYNLCFTTVDKRNPNSEEAVNCGRKGILPEIMENLTKMRIELKNKMNTLQDDKFNFDRFLIKQQAIKSLSNSIYGYLGFSLSRFSSNEIAALITERGRYVLQKTVETVESLGKFSVIYGDTDSVMVNTGTKSIEDAKNIANNISEKVTKQYKFLKLTVSGIFTKMLLVAKKKYAVTVYDDDKKCHREVKGLDMVRRDWCQLTKYLSSFVLDQMMNNDDRSMTVRNCLSEFHNVAKLLRNSSNDDNNSLFYYDENFSLHNKNNKKDKIKTQSNTENIQETSKNEQKSDVYDNKNISNENDDEQKSVNFLSKSDTESSSIPNYQEVKSYSSSPKSDKSDTKSDTEEPNSSKSFHLKKITKEMLIIYRQLNKKISEYSDKRNNPHVSIALRMIKRGEKVPQHATIPMIVTSPDIRELCDKVKLPDEVKDMSEIDSQWYLVNQILPPIIRLFAPYGHVGSSTIGRSLGLTVMETKKNINDSYENSFNEDIPHKRELFYRCQLCGKNIRFTRDYLCSLRCSNCCETHNWKIVSNLLVQNVRDFISESVKENLNDSELHSTLRYFLGIFSNKKVLTEDDEDFEEFRCYMEKRIYSMLDGHIYNHVDISSLISFK